VLAGYAHRNHQYLLLTSQHPVASALELLTAAVVAAVHSEYPLTPFACAQILHAQSLHQDIPQEDVPAGAPVVSDFDSMSPFETEALGEANPLPGLVSEPA